jgi:hypothetical protein
MLTRRIASAQIFLMNTIWCLVFISAICCIGSGCRQKSPPVTPLTSGRFEIHAEDYQMRENGEEFTEHALWKIDTATGRTWMYIEELNTNSGYIGWKEIGTIPGVLEHTGNIADKGK